MREEQWIQLAGKKSDIYVVSKQLEHLFISWDVTTQDITAMRESTECSSC